MKRALRHSFHCGKFSNAEIQFCSNPKPNHDPVIPLIQNWFWTAKAVLHFSLAPLQCRPTSLRRESLHVLRSLHRWTHPMPILAIGTPSSYTDRSITQDLVPVQLDLLTNSYLNSYECTTTYNKLKVNGTENLEERASLYFFEELTTFAIGFT